MSITTFIVDAFTDKAFTGNPAAVCLLDVPQETQWMQAVAAEMNLSETAFIVVPQPQDASQVYLLRWFTPKIEVDLCGHATLASAHVLWYERGDQTQVLAFQTKSGLLYASKVSHGIELDFPARPAQPVVVPQELVAALGVEPIQVAKNAQHYLIELANEEAVRKLTPDFDALSRIRSARGFIVTARAVSGIYDFVSRFFAPAAGINEDPVTGVAHCCLAPWWGTVLGKNELIAYQASPRGGVLRLRQTGSRVALTGTAVTVLKGELYV